MSRANVARFALAGLLVLAVGFALAYRGRIDVAALQAWLEGQGAAAPFAFVAFYALATVLFLPGSVLTLAGGALFGPVAGTFYSLMGATLGAAGAFLIARYVAGDWVARKSGGRLKQLIEGVEAEGWRFVAFVRLVPLFPFNLLNYALGLTRVPFGRYVVTSLICMFPGAVAYTYLGYAGRAAVEGSQNMIRIVLLALALLAVALFLPTLIKRLRQAPAATAGKLNSAELKERLARKDDIAVLDVRPAKDYIGELGHIPGSVNIPLDELPKRLSELEGRREQPLAVICRTNRMSGKAVTMLRDAGFRQALLVEDGMVGWRGKPGTSPQPEACSAFPPTKPSAGTGKTVTLIIQNAPYKGDNKAWHALRFAGAALVEDMKVRVHLLDDGAQLARKGHQVPPGAVDLEKLLGELMECGLEVRACGMALNDCKLDVRDLIPGVQQGSMKALANWVKESDLVLTF